MEQICFYHNRFAPVLYRYILSTVYEFSAFAYCSNLIDIIIPDSVTFIGKCAFSDCTNLTSITIPDSVTSIEENTFDGCDNLTIYGIHNDSYARNHNIPFISKHKIENIIETEATCTATGLKVSKCYDCNKIIYSESLPMIDHTFSDWQTFEPTCTAEGTQSRSCTMCNKKESIKTKDALGHDYTTEITKPTCTGKEGYTTYTCTRCGNSYKIVLTHKCTVCAGTGYEKHTCRFCNATGYKQKTTTCTSCNGTGKTSQDSTAKCSFCHGEKVYFSTSSQSWIVCPFCKGAGTLPYTETKTCKSCNGQGTKNVKVTCSYCDGKGSTSDDCLTCLGTGKIPDKGEHDYGSWNITIPATSISNGIKERTCTVCGITETQSIPYTTTSPEETIKPTETVPATDASSKGSASLAAPYNTPIPAPDTMLSTTDTPSHPQKLTAKNKKKNTVTLSWKSVTSANGYEICYATNKKFTKQKKSKFVTKTTATIKKLKKKKTYYFKVRAYKLDGTKKVYGTWSVIKTAKIKK